MIRAGSQHDGLGEVKFGLSPKEPEVAASWLPQPIDPEAIFVDLHLLLESVEEPLKARGAQSALEDGFLDTLPESFAHMSDPP